MDWEKYWKREREKERQSMGIVVLVALILSLLIIGIMSARGEWLRMNG